MLQRADGTDFSTGRSRFADQAHGSGEDTAKIYVRIELEALGDVVLAQLDTGSPWLILQTEIAAAMSLQEGEGPVVPLSTRQGRVTGHLERILVNILADEGEGDSLQVEATAFVSRQWPAGTFLGYSGVLERIRFAIDPSDNFFYFGPI